MQLAGVKKTWSFGLGVSTQMVEGGVELGVSQ
jgi:hypothetical protein